MNRPTGLPWASRLGPYSPLCAALKKPWIAKERCPASTGGMWMTHWPSCLTKHQPTTFWRLLTNAKLDQVYHGDRKQSHTSRFLGTQLFNKSTHVKTKVYVKPTNSGLLLHYKSHVDDRYKRGPLKTMLARAFRLSSFCPTSLKNAIVSSCCSPVLNSQII